MKVNYVVFFFLALSIPVLLGLNVWHSNECEIIRKKITRNEKAQEEYIEINKTLANEIRNLTSVSRLEDSAKEKLGLEKVRPEDVMLIFLGGKSGN